jgi:hypothetical protein
MKIKISFFLLIFCMLICKNSFAQQDTISKGKGAKKVLGSTIIRVSDSVWFRTYNPEQGYFQKANFDKGDPRFMVANENQTFKFGIGGFVKVVAFGDFNGSIPDNDFITSLIPIPTLHYGQFRIFANQSRFNLKVVGRIKKHTIVSFIEGNFNSANNAFKLRHAYVSFLGLTIGQTWSTFMDLQASPPTIDGEGPNNQIAIRHPMIRYTYYYKDRFQTSIAAEMSEILMREIAASPFKVYAQPQRIPDITAHFKLQGKFGHVQLGGVFRIMNHGDSTQTNKSVFVPGGGLALSGTFNLWKNAKLYYQLNGGKGIATYIQDLSLFDYDLLPTFGNRKMNTVWMYGGYLGLQQYWTKKLHSNVVYGITRLQVPNDDHGFFSKFVPSYYRYGQYLAVNTLWNFFDFATAGVEILWGERVNLNREKGHAHRINLLLQYDF